MSDSSIDYTDEIWSKDDNLMVRLYRPPNTNNEEDKKYPAILDLLGGMWNYNNRTLDQVSNTALADAGFVVAAIDFRQGPTHHHPAASQDVVKALVWLREEADRLHIDTDRIGILGSSSGGHLAMYAGLTPNSKRMELRERILRNLDSLLPCGQCHALSNDADMPREPKSNGWLKHMMRTLSPKTICARLAYLVLSFLVRQNSCLHFLWSSLEKMEMSPLK